MIIKITVPDPKFFNHSRNADGCLVVDICTHLIKSPCISSGQYNKIKKILSQLCLHYVCAVWFELWQETKGKFLFPVARLRTTGTIIYIQHTNSMFSNTTIMRNNYKLQNGFRDAHGTPRMDLLMLRLHAAQQFVELRKIDERESKQ